MSTKATRPSLIRLRSGPDDWYGARQLMASASARASSRLGPVEAPVRTRIWNGGPLVQPGAPGRPAPGHGLGRPGRREPAEGDRRAVRDQLGGLFRGQTGKDMRVWSVSGRDGRPGLRRRSLGLRVWRWRRKRDDDPRATARWALGAHLPAVLFTSRATTAAISPSRASAACSRSRAVALDTARLARTERSSADAERW